VDRTGQWQMLVRGAEMGAYLPAVELVGLCPSGQIWSAAQSSCWMCPAGSFADAMICGGAQRCTACPAGSYSASGSEVCAACPTGRYSASGSEVCTACAAGSYSGGSGEACLACSSSFCAVGEYRGACGAEDDGVCGGCTNSRPTHSVYVSAGTPFDVNKCDWECDVGFFQDGDVSCGPCTNMPGDASYTSAGVPGIDLCSWTCALDYFSKDSADCVACPSHTGAAQGSNTLADCKCVLGYTAVSDGVACTACDAGTYKAATGAGECVTCPARTSSASGSDELTACKCLAGYNGTLSGAACTACMAGMFKNAVGEAECQFCPANSESSAGSALCYCSAGFSGVDGGPCVACSDCTSAISFTATLVMTLTEFTAAKRDTYVAGVAQALSLAPSSVAIASVIPKTKALDPTPQTRKTEHKTLNPKPKP